ncbi:hypothetical protein PGTUg99_015315 [Puccinia graminis f. sp. tritici]|uniref:Uncharacterized protein n=1 Tax=Puccinia graminis f. sp. tritici TaxID=56615 RepID=A0A5B0NIZ2_PUCGR|nr:hypothetical protein PGTUg99_015315 [Puccinia graminis f. sp. tritici]
MLLHWIVRSMDGDEASESESSSRGQQTATHRVIRALKELLDYYQFSLSQSFCHHVENISIDRLDWKRKILNDLQTSLLPLIKRQISVLLNSLDLSHMPIHACPNPELTLQIVSEIEHTLDETRSAVELIALRQPLPASSHDHHLEKFKSIRSLRLMRKTKTLIQENLCDLFEACALLIWEHENNDPEDLGYQAHASKRRQRITIMAADYQDRVDRLIEWSKLSDFGFLQHEWRLASYKLNETLEVLGKMTNESYSISSNNDKEDDQIAEDRSVEDEETKRLADHRERANQLAQSFIPFIKLGRIFYDKLSKTAINRLPFELYTEMSSDQLELLANRTSWIESSINDLMGELSRLHNSSEDFERRISWMRNEAIMTLYRLDRTLLDLSLNLIPVHTTTSTAYSSSPPQSHFKTWFLPLKKQFRAACVHFLRTINIGFGDLLGQDSGSESEEDENENENNRRVEEDPIPDSESRIT